MSEGYTVTLQAVIPAGQSQSNALYLGAAVVAGLQMPSGWDAAGITLLSGPDEATLQNAHKEDGNEYSISVAASRHVILDPTILSGLGVYVKLRSGTSAVPVNQTVERTIGVVCRRLA